MNAVPKILGGTAALLLAGAMAVGPTAGGAEAASAAALPAASTSASATPASTASAATTTIVTATNEQRRARGLPALKENAALRDVAQAWAKRMAVSGRMSHNPNYSTQIPTGWRAAGENVATGFATPRATVTAWMGSAGHRANILSSSYTDMGAGWFVDAAGKTWSVQVFAGYPAR